MKAKIRIAGGAVLLVALAVLWTNPAGAATHTVTNLNDSGAGSLRQAIIDSANGDTIAFASDLSGTITLASDLPNLGSVTFSGGGDVTLIHTGSTNFRTFSVDAGATLSGDLAFDVQAEAPSGSNVYGFNGSGDLTVGTLSGVVSASAGTHSAIGIIGANSLTVGTLSGTVSASAGTYNTYGLATFGALTVGTLSGSVSVSAGSSSAYGLYSLNGAITVTDLSGAVSVSAGTNTAYGLYSENGAISVDDLSGSVSASAGTNKAYGLFTGGAMTVGTLSGSVSATAGTYGAYGVLSRGTLGNGAGGATEISGSVRAEANGLAVAVGARQGMDLTVTGTLSATDTSGAGKAYAIAAGEVSGSSWSAGGDYDDTVTLGSGASITGNIELGGGTNLLTLEDAGTLIGDITGITTLTKNGSGTWSTSGSISTGDFTVDEGILHVEVSQAASPTITATGTFTNNGEVNFSLDGSFAAGRFTALTSSGLAGTGTYTTDSLFLTAEVNGNDVNLTKLSFTDVFSGTEDDWEQVAAALDDNYATASGDLADLILAMEQSSSQAEAEAAMDQMTSSLLVQGVDTSVATARLQSLTTQFRMAGMRAYQIARADSSTPDPDDPASWPLVAAIGDLSGLFNRSPESSPNGLHLRAVGRSGSMDSHDGYDGYDYKTTLLSGGYDRMIGHRLLAGLSAGYAATGTDYKDTGGSDSTLSTYTLGLYASVFDRAWYIDGLLSGAFNSYDTDRRLPALSTIAKSESEGSTLSAKTEGGYRFGLGGFGLTPTASLEYTRFHQDGYTETGAGAANMVIGGYDTDFLESGVGVKLDMTWKTGAGLLVPEVSAMWMHEWLSQDRNLTYSLTGLPGTLFSQTLAETARDSVNIGAGLRYLSENGLTLTARYQGQFEEHGRSHSLMVEAQFVF